MKFQAYLILTIYIAFVYGTYKIIIKRNWPMTTRFLITVSTITVAAAIILAIPTICEWLYMIIPWEKLPVPLFLLYMNLLPFTYTMDEILETSVISFGYSHRFAALSTDLIVSPLLFVAIALNRGWYANEEDEGEQNEATDNRSINIWTALAIGGIFTAFLMFWNISVLQR